MIEEQKEICTITEISQKLKIVVNYSPFGPIENKMREWLKDYFSNGSIQLHSLTNPHEGENAGKTVIILSTNHPKTVKGFFQEHLDLRKIKS